MINFERRTMALNIAVSTLSMPLLVKLFRILPKDSELVYCTQQREGQPFRLVFVNAEWPIVEPGCYIPNYLSDEYVAALLKETPIHGATDLPPRVPRTVSSPAVLNKTRIQDSPSELCQCDLVYNGGHFAHCRTLKRK